VSLLDAGRIIESGKLADVTAQVNSQLSRALLPLPTHTPVSADLVLEVVGQAEAVNTPIGSVLAAEHPVSVDVVGANIETLGGTLFAHYLLAINSAEPINVTGLEASILRHGFVVRTRPRQGVRA